MNTTALFGVAATPAIVGLVQVMKQMGLPQRAAPLLAVALGILGGGAQQFATSSPDGAAWVQAAVTGIGLGLSAAGLYSGARTVLVSTEGRSDGEPAAVAHGDPTAHDGPTVPPPSLTPVSRPGAVDPAPAATGTPGDRPPTISPGGSQ